MHRPGSGGARSPYLETFVRSCQSTEASRGELAAHQQGQHLRSDFKDQGTLQIPVPAPDVWGSQERLYSSSLAIGTVRFECLTTVLTVGDSLSRPGGNVGFQLRGGF